MNFAVACIHKSKRAGDTGEAGVMMVSDPW